MSKLKSHSGAKKRFSKTGTGRIKRARASKSHLLTHKRRVRKRRLKKTTIVDATSSAQVNRLIPYK